MEQYDFTPETPTKQPVRRVGTLTMGLALMAAGGIALAAMFWPEFDLLLAAKFSPLLLILLGGEVLWFAAHPGSCRIKYDFLSMLVCFLVLCASMVILLLPTVFRMTIEYRDTQQRLSYELVQQVREQLAEEKLVDVDCWVDLHWSDFDPDMTVQELRFDEWGTLTLYLGGTQQSRRDFADRCAELNDRVSSWEIRPMDLSLYGSGPAEGEQYYLRIPQLYQPIAAEDLLELVEHWGGEPAGEALEEALPQAQTESWTAEDQAAVTAYGEAGPTDPPPAGVRQ